MCELKIKPCPFLMKRFADRLSSSLPRISQLSCLEYTQFLALYVATAAFNLLLHSVILWALKIIERDLKTYLSWSKTQWEFHQGLQKSTDEKKNVRFPLHWSLVSSLIGQKKCGKPLAAAFSRCFLDFHVKWKLLIKICISKKASFHF